MSDTIAYLLITTELGRAERVAEEAVKLEGVQWAVVVTGPYDVIVAAKTRDNEALFALVADDIQSIDGVLDTETALMGSWHESSARGIHPIP